MKDSLLVAPIAFAQDKHVHEKPAMTIKMMKMMQRDQMLHPMPAK